MSFDPLTTSEVSHFVGIGGIGMSGLAQLLAAQGKQVTGSDICPNLQTNRLETAGIPIFYGHRADNIRHATRLIYSSAIKPDNPELLAARSSGLSIYHRAELLATLASDYRMVGVSGTHGKTTTSSMIAVMLYLNGLDPTVIVGGEINELEGHARLGWGPHLVAEVDESDGSLILFSPEVAVVTNIEDDHLDHYGDLGHIVEAFRQFTSQANITVGCLDCPAIRAHLNVTLGYSLEGHPDADYTVEQVVYKARSTTARVLERGAVLGELQLQVIGRHNLTNALAAVAVGRHLGLKFDQIAQGLAQFTGAGRRFQLMGEREGITFIDDYAHHPSEIRATLSAARLHERRVVAVFQPHRYSRSLLLLDEFGPVFEAADEVVVTAIYAAGELDRGLVSGEQVAQAVARHHANVHYEPSFEGLKRYLYTHLHPDDLVLFLGAGNLNQIIPELIEPARAVLPPALAS
ncbi:MAG: UDP-N-acetylmuramate--L-alanine ligase [Gemmatimonadaceae bacterium]|nr:UDP-N-acetylmuramate--L-alanine ligase [Gloeobacterales cyanobacterium ES-bin-141]